jgi:sigma-B regulation protein RsbU (phosphoserine phosphatase)
MSTFSDYLAIETENSANLSKGAGQLLVVEPDPNARLKIADALKSDFKILFALNGRQALDILMKHSIRIVISDPNLPVLSGLDLLSEMKGASALSSIPFVAMSGEVSESFRVDCLNKGASEYVLKPFSQVEFLARVKNIAKMRDYQIRLEQGLFEARIIQHALMPASQLELPNARFEYLYYPCEELSGDFLDAIQMDDDVFIYLADVTSHGTAASQVTYLIRGLFREAVLQGRLTDLNDILLKVGRSFCALGLDYGVAIRAIKLNCKTRQLKISGSNAPAPIVFRNREVFEFKVSSQTAPMIDADLWKDETFPVDSVNLQPGDFIYIFTDGCVEFPANGGREIGFKRFSSILRDADPKNWRTSLMDKFVELHGNPKFPDDITIGRLQIT